MGENVVAKAVGDERIEQAVGFVNRPVLAQLFRTEHKHALVFQLEVFDDRQRLVGLTQANAIGDDAAVVPKNFVDGALHPVLLKLEERLPNLRLEKTRLAEFGVRLAGIAEERLEDVEERLVVDEFRRVVLVELLEVFENVLLHVLHERIVAPKLIEPLLEFLPVAVAIDDEIQLDVVVAHAEPEAAHGEVGASENRVLHAGRGDVIHFPVEQIRLLDGLDVHLAVDPVGALFRDTLLLKLVGQFQPLRVDDERLLFCLAWIEPVDE